MANDLITVTRELTPVMAPLLPTLERLLPPALPPERLLQTLYVSCANNPGLMRANRQTLIQAAGTAAVLGLEVDGVTGQGYLVPYKQRAQFITGYKGMCTLAGRAQRTLEGFVVREGDSFEFDEANGLVEHRRRLGDEDTRRIIAAYAVSRGQGVPTIVRVLSIDQVLAVRDASAGWRSKGQSSPWGTNFDAMARKTPMRRLANDLPVLGLQQAAALETQHDLGHHAYLEPEGGLVVDGELVSNDKVRDVRERDVVEAEQPSADEMLEREPLTVYFPTSEGEQRRTKSDVMEYITLLNRGLRRNTEEGGTERRLAFIRANIEELRSHVRRHPTIAGIVETWEGEL